MLAARPEGLPHIFVDRSLGRMAVPRLLRQAGIDLTTLADHYGIPHDEKVEDVTWLADTARLGWAAFMKDERIRRRPAERAAVIKHAARCFYINRQNLPGPEMVQRFIDNLDTIITACAEADPFIYAVHSNQIKKMDLDP
ncbi:PIN-like domain-containing protein [Frankia sp. CiP1_Cm_nod2]|uniref:PIN-like domain-containing protein n=1 Tax=Frankia sp. CiP1_Cm_nod2 TaxID=2897161 RepID=UPI002024F7E6